MAPKKGSKAKATKDSKSPLSTRHICVSAASGETASLVFELLLHKDFTSSYKSLSAIAHEGDDTSDLEDAGINVITFSKDLDLGDIDTMLLIPPARKDKFDVCKSLLESAAKSKGVVNLVLLSSAGCDYAERDEQPRLREFIDLEQLAMSQKSNESSEDTGHSPCIVRAGFYAENLLLYSAQAQKEGKLPLPIGEAAKFAPVALGDVALLLVKILTSEGEHGFGDQVRGQMITLTGPIMVAGPELASAASEGVGNKLEFESISAEDAKNILASDQGEEVDEAEKEYLLEYYDLVRQGKTGYVSTQGFQEITGQAPQELEAFFKVHADSFKQEKKRRVGNKSKRGQPASSGEKNGNAKKRKNDPKKAEGEMDVNDGDNSADFVPAVGDMVVE